MKSSSKSRYTICGAHQQTQTKMVEPVNVHTVQTSPMGQMARQRWNIHLVAQHALSQKPYCERHPPPPPRCTIKTIFIFFQFPYKNGRLSTASGEWMGGWAARWDEGRSLLPIRARAWASCMFGHNVAEGRWCMVNKRGPGDVVPTCFLLNDVNGHHHARLIPNPTSLRNQIDYHQVFLISDKTFRKWSVSWMRRTPLWHLVKRERECQQPNEAMVWFGSGYRRGVVLRVTHCEMNNHFWQNVCSLNNISSSVANAGRKIRTGDVIHN